MSNNNIFNEAMYRINNNSGTKEDYQIVVQQQQQQMQLANTTSNQFSFLSTTTKTAKSCRKRRMELLQKMKTYCGKNDVLRSSKCKIKNRMRKLASDLTTTNDNINSNKVEMQRINQELSTLPEEEENDDNEDEMSLL